MFAIRAERDYVIEEDFMKVCLYTYAHTDVRAHTNTHTYHPC